MNKTLLINRIDTKNFQNEEKRIFFLVDTPQAKNLHQHLIDTLSRVEILRKENIIYKYNGVEICMNEKDIPKIIKVLMEADINIYSVYELYDPMQ